MTSILVKPMFLPWRGTLRLLAMGVISGWLGVVGLPTTSSSGLPLTTLAAIAQNTISNEEITQYARAVLEIDQYRNDAYTEIKDLLLAVDMTVSDINFTCSGSQDLSRVPRSVRRTVRETLADYCNQSQDAVEGNGLSPKRFNEITAAHEADQNVFERIQQELIRLQRGE
jgi:hypothetical protein